MVEKEKKMNAEETVAKYFGIKDKNMEDMLNEYAHQIAAGAVAKELNKNSNPFDDRKVRHALYNVIDDIKDKTGK